MTAPACIQLCTREDARWRELRCIGSSDSPTLFGCGYAESSILGLWTEKVLGPGPDRDDAKLRAGRVLQPAIARLASMELGGPVREVEILFRSTRWPWMTCTPDFEIEHPDHGWMDLETKNTTAVEEWPKEKPCARHWIQCQHQMAVRGRAGMILYGLLFGYQTRRYWVPRDDRFIEQELVPETGRLWQMIRTRTRPDPDHTASSSEAIQRLFPFAAGTAVELDPEASDMTDRCLELDEQMKPMKQERETLRNKIKVAMGTAELGLLPDGHWTYAENVNGQRALRYWPGRWEK
jgi:predicted phage-related endonuclease